MTITEKTEFGVVRFMPVETYANPYRGLSADERTEKIFEALTSDETIPPSVGDWPRVSESIYRDGVFVIETSAPSFKAMLRFCPERPSEGSYEIHHRPHGGIERGNTFKITPIAADETDGRLSMLAPFENRYAIVTAADNRAKTHLMWLVGLRNVRKVSEAEDGM